MFNRRTLWVVASVIALAGCATSSRTLSLADVIAAQPQLTTFNSLVIKAGLKDTFTSGGPYTVFAPSNEAFTKVPAKTMDALAQDPAKLKALLNYHVLPGKHLVADLKNGNSKTVNGANVALSKAGDFLTVESAVVQTPDLVARNGVLQVVDSVLMPPAAR